MGAWPAVFVFGVTTINLIVEWGVVAAVSISLFLAVCIGLVGSAVTVLAGLRFN